MEQMGKNTNIKKAVPPQKTLATMSRHAPGCMLDIVPFSCSLEIGCRVGSIPTPGHISVSKVAVKSRISLWRMVG